MKTNIPDRGYVPEGLPLGVSSTTTDEEEAFIDREFEGLLNDYRNTRKGDKVDLIRRVFFFARQAHGNNRRLNGTPYICHPLAVARIVAHNIGLGSTSISAALLHDVVKDTNVTFEDLEREFGSRITGLVQSLTRISGDNMRFTAALEEQHSTTINIEEQAENFRNLLLTISEDVRVILVKVADRLHNMRTLDALSEFKQKRIAAETLYLYAPIADRLGLYRIKQELEELSLQYDFPEEYRELKARMKDAETHYADIFTTFAAPVRSLLDELGLEYSFQYRMKPIYSVWRKMRKKHISFDEVYDLFAARIVFTPSSPTDEKTDCWRIYSALTSIYKIHPDRIRDWISHPKQSGYEALQVTVLGPDHRWIEVQIRSERMNQEAEEGVAAHWKYKSGKVSDNGLSKWMQNIKDILDNPSPNATDFLDQINLNVLSSTIYVFTRSGELHPLAKDATALDFAFSLHTDIGLHAEAARIDHELMPLNTPLANGQQVEILTSDVENVTEQWITWVNTTRAKAKIRQVLHKRQKATGEKPSKQPNKLLSLLGGMVKKKKQRPQGQQPEAYVPRTTTLELQGIDARGLLNTITLTIGETCTANIVNIHLECKDGLFRGYLTIDNNDDAEVQKLCKALLQIHGIEKAHRK